MVIDVTMKTGIEELRKKSKKKKINFRKILSEFEAVTRFDFVPYPVMQGMSRMELELSEKLIKIISKWFEVLIDMYPMSKQEVEHIDEGLLLNVWRDSV